MPHTCTYMYVHNIVFLHQLLFAQLQSLQYFLLATVRSVPLHMNIILTKVSSTFDFIHVYLQVYVSGYANEEKRKLLQDWHMRMDQTWSSPVCVLNDTIELTPLIINKTCGKVLCLSWYCVAVSAASAKEQFSVRCTCSYYVSCL